MNEKSRAPKNPRKSKIDPKIREFIKSFRLEYSKAGKEKIQSELDAFCYSLGLETLSEPTIGRVIKVLKEKGEIPKKVKVSLYGKTGKLVIRELKPRKPKLRRKGYQPEYSQHLIQIDAVVKFIWESKDILSLLFILNQSLPLPKPILIYPLNQLLISLRN